MRVGMYYNNSKVELEELPVPKVGARDILIKVMASGICGSDVLEWYRIKKAPLVLGHELAGEVVEVGDAITEFKPGDRVFATHHVPCDACHWCVRGHQTACPVFQTKNNFDPGGFAEYLRVTGKSIETGTLMLPDSVSYEQLVHRAPRHGSQGHAADRDFAGRHARRARLRACGPAHDKGRARPGRRQHHSDRRGRSTGLEAAKRFGAQVAIRADADLPAAIREVTGGRLADKVIVCAGVLPAAQQALLAVDRGGTVLFFAVPNPGEMLSVDLTPFWRNDVRMKTCYGAAPLDNRQALDLITAGSVEVRDMITHRFGLADIAKGFRTAGAGKDCLKVIITPHD